MRRIVFVFAFLLIATSAFAQQLPPGKWWRRPEIVQSLNLSNDQQDKLDDIFRAAASELIDLRGDVEKANIALRGELDRPQLDRAAIHRIATRLSDARAKLFDRELMMLVDMRGVLNDQQWNRMRNELDKLQQQRPMQRPRR